MCCWGCRQIEASSSSEHAPTVYYSLTWTRSVRAPA
ncbi:unnamed protein product [Amoebophrya sp. A120]|nr:unnamed protein product [Amoebophrya sp. A120]|eukprot:GSA120T00016622001.1